MTMFRHDHGMITAWQPCFSNSDYLINLITGCSLKICNIWGGNIWMEKISTKRSFANLASFENFYRKFIVSSSQRYWKQQQKQQFNSKLLGMEADFKKLFLLLFLCLQKKTCSINFLDINYKRSNDCRRRLMPSVVRHRKSWRFKDFQFSQKHGFI